MISLVAVVLLDVDMGLGVAVAWSLLTVVFRTQVSRCLKLLRHLQGHYGARSSFQKARPAGRAGLSLCCVVKVVDGTFFS